LVRGKTGNSWGLGGEQVGISNNLSATLLQPKPDRIIGQIQRTQLLLDLQAKLPSPRTPNMGHYVLHRDLTQDRRYRFLSHPRHTRHGCHDNRASGGGSPLNVCAHWDSRGRRGRHSYHAEAGSDSKGGHSLNHSHGGFGWNTSDTLHLCRAFLNGQGSFRVIREGSQ
jgi:hypothetical protein